MNYNSKFLRWPILPILLCLALTGCENPSKSELRGFTQRWRAVNPTWRGVHLMAHSDEQIAALIAQLPEFVAAGANVLVIEVNYSFQFQSHRELCSGTGISKQRARELASAARERGIRIIPQFNCLGHQSWSKNTLPLLVRYPDFDETPGQYPENKGIYCRSWCLQHPKVNRVIFSLIDELIDAFEADAFHVGMDEVFLIGSEHCPRCRGGDPAKLFAKAVNDLHQHIVREKKLEMLMWGDRLLPANLLGYSEWEASRNHTEGAADLIPKNIIVCDWHYDKRAEYPSISWLAKRGFRVWPSAWQPLEAATAFSAYSQQLHEKRVLGWLCTTWGKVSITQAPSWPPIKEVLPKWKQQ